MLHQHLLCLLFALWATSKWRTLNLFEMCYSINCILFLACFCTNIQKPIFPFSIATLLFCPAMVHKTFLSMWQIMKLYLLLDNRNNLVLLWSGSIYKTIHNSHSPLGFVCNSQIWAILPKVPPIRYNTHEYIAYFSYDTIFWAAAPIGAKVQ